MKSLIIILKIELLTLDCHILKVMVNEIWMLSADFKIVDVCGNFGTWMAVLI
jgi:hypothetical protein